MKGFRVLLINALTAAMVAGLTYLAGVNWTDHVSPTAAVVLVALVNMALRFITTTPVGKAD